VPNDEPFELVIFDCDGVLVDSERLSVRIEVAILADLGWPLTEREIVERFVGRSDEQMRREIEAYLGRALDDDWEDAYAHLYRDAFEHELTAVPGVVAALDRIDAPTCVASSGTHDKMRFTLGMVGLYDRFEGRIFSATEVEHGKPAPDLFLHAARRMGAPPERCAVIEDSRWGVEAARAAGMTALAYVGGGLTPVGALQGPGTTVFSDMADLPALLRGSTDAASGATPAGS
jgi:HAD superfamily hydrolase (TIGR01509 family)